MRTVKLGKRGADRLRGGHPWIYRSDLFADPGESIPTGEDVLVTDHRDQALATVFYSVRSKIALRVVAREARELDPAWWRGRLDAAIALRERLYPGRRFVRLVNGDADGLPGLVVDRFGAHLSLQAGVPAVDRRLELIGELLQERLAPEGIVARNDAKVRELEGLPLEKRVLRGTYAGRVVHEEGDARMWVDLLEGQKTGTFLDQAENHLLAGDYAAGEALDLFSYVGGFALQLARRATKVTAVEISGAACAAIRENATLSGRTNVEAVEANVFDFLRDRLAEGRRYDTIVLDPPAFAKNKQALEAAIRGYKEVNLRALQLLAPGGVLLTFTCSYHVSADDFEATVTDAIRDARRPVQLLERRGASRDHPVLLTVPETRYLKGLVLRASA